MKVILLDEIIEGVFAYRSAGETAEVETEAAAE